MAVEFTLTYRTGATANETDARDFMMALALYCHDRGISPKLAASKLQDRGGRSYWVVIADLPRGFTAPLPDRSGLWPHGMSQVVRYRGQVAADAAAWFAGLYTRWSICVLPEFLTHSQNSAPDTFSGVSQ
ncbi:MAG: hypothetical protein ACRES5_05195 [Pseudomonas sp.]|uniref:hypothetical protein n=1 Tax=Stenotrophomonas sp. TaxID=69392 RepID=UPI003D6C8B10